MLEEQQEKRRQNKEQNCCQDQCNVNQHPLLIDKHEANYCPKKIQKKPWLIRLFEQSLFTSKSREDHQEGRGAKR
jgi:hypothetical protein